MYFGPLELCPPGAPLLPAARMLGYSSPRRPGWGGRLCLSRGRARHTAEKKKEKEKKKRKKKKCILLLINQCRHVREQMRLAFRLFFLSSAMEERSKYLQGASYARHVESEVAQSCPIFCHPMDCSLPGSSVYGIFQARALKQAAISFSRGSSQPRDRTWVSCIANRHFTI